MWVGWALVSLTVCKTAAKAVLVRFQPGPPYRASFEEPSFVSHITVSTGNRVIELAGVH